MSRNPGQYLAFLASLWRVMPTFAALWAKPAMTSVNFRIYGTSLSGEMEPVWTFLSRG
jgi:hypothetical protein